MEPMGPCLEPWSRTMKGPSSQDAIFEYMGLQRHQTLGDTTGALASGGGAPEGLQSSLLLATVRLYRHT